MLLDSTHIPDLHKVLTQGKKEAISKIKRGEITLATSLSLGILHHRLMAKGLRAEAEEIARLGFPSVTSAINTLNHSGHQRSPEPFGAPSFELYRISGSDDLKTEDWPLFYGRFRRAALKGRKGEMYHSVSGAFAEMGDNLVSHAYNGQGGPFLGLAGFHVTDQSASFCVTDAGQGFLKSLSQDPRWQELSTESDALNAVVRRHATSRAGEVEGGGFKDLFNMLLAFNGLVFLRSQDCAFQITNRGPKQDLFIRPSQGTEGSSITVVISENSVPKEHPLCRK